MVYSEDGRNARLVIKTFVTVVTIMSPVVKTEVLIIRASNYFGVHEHMLVFSLFRVKFRTCSPSPSLVLGEGGGDCTLGKVEEERGLC